MVSSRRIPRIPLLAHSLRLLRRALVWAPRTIRQFHRRRRAAKPGGSRPQLLFYYSQVVWQEVWQRPQEVALGLADSVPVLFMSPLQVHRLYDSVPDWRHTFSVDRGCGLRVGQPLILPGEYKSSLIFTLNHRLIWAEACALLPPDGDVVLVSNSPFSADLLDRFDWARRVYDVIDDFPAFSWAPPDARAMEDRWLDRADAVVAGTHTLAELHRPRRTDIEFIPSGVRFEQFHDCADDTPADLRDLPQPMLGYIGTVSDRLDRRLLEDLGRAFPDGSVVLIGPVHGSFDRPQGVGNLHLLGPRPHEELPAYVRRFDLALLPFAMTAATQAINPVKTLEYLAAGKVVISTPVPDVVRFFSEEVLIARDREAFVRTARQALTSDTEDLRRKGIERARQATWDRAIARIARRAGLRAPQESTQCGS